MSRTCDVTVANGRAHCARPLATDPTLFRCRAHNSAPIKIPYPPPPPLAFLSTRLACRLAASLHRRSVQAAGRPAAARGCGGGTAGAAAGARGAPWPPTTGKAGVGPRIAVGRLGKLEKGRVAPRAHTMAKTAQFASLGCISIYEFSHATKLCQLTFSRSVA